MENKKICPVCGGVVLSKRAAVCSANCSVKWSRLNKDKQKPTKNCLVCGNEFIANRQDKRCCSANCASRLHYHTRHKKENKFNQLKTCTNCGNEKPLSSFYRAHKTYFSFCKSCYDLHNVDKFYIAKLKVDNFVDVETYIYKIKKQRWMATDADIFELIDIFDRLFPDNLTTYKNPLDTLNYYFHQLAVWYKNKKESIYSAL